MQLEDHNFLTWHVVVSRTTKSTSFKSIASFFNNTALMLGKNNAIAFSGKSIAVFFLSIYWKKIYSILNSQICFHWRL